MDNNEIPPYDMPFDDKEDKNNNGMDMEVNMSDDNPPAEPLPDDFMSFNDEALQQEQPLQDEISAAAPSPAPQPKKGGGGGIIATLIIIFLLLIALIGVLAFFYADSLNLPFLSSKKSGSEVTDLKPDETDELNSLPGEEQELDGEMNNVLSENTEGTGIEITRNSNNTGNEFPPGINQENNMMNNSAENYPPLPGQNRENMVNNQNGFDNQNNQNNQNNELARARYYSGGSVGRLDPFNPKNNTGSELFEIIVPPIDPAPDQETQSLMTLRISGIMYTPDAPSAIINIAGQDQLVRKGDSFNGFNVVGITKDKVTVKNGKNVYTASVGEILNVDQVGINAIPNLNKKFAGPYSKGKDRIIEINMLD